MFLMMVTLLLDAARPPGTPSVAAVTSAIERYPFARGRATYRIDTIRSVRCRAFDEEPTEYRCKFRAWDIQQARWTQRSVIVTFDNEWVVLGMD